MKIRIGSKKGRVMTRKAGRKPWMKLVLLDSDDHLAPLTPVAIVYKVYSGDKKRTDNSLYLRRMPDGTVRHDASYEPLFGELLTEPHPTRPCCRRKTSCGLCRKSSRRLTRANCFCRRSLGTESIAKRTKMA
jgi:hypothetical protein